MTIATVGITLHEKQSPLGGHPGEIVVLDIVTDDGEHGIAFLGGPGPTSHINARILGESVRPVLLGRNPLDRGRIWTELWERRAQLGLGIVGAVDVALWDLAGQRAGLPVHRLLGTVRSSLPAYISSWVHDHPQDYADEALHYMELGYRAYKIHPPTQHRRLRGEGVPLSADLNTAREVRRAVGPDMILMSDSPNVYSYDEALRMGRELEALDFHWFEDPLPTEDIYGYTRLRKHLSIPLVATEMTSDGPYGYAPWILAGATDCLRGDVHCKGGITALQRIAHTAESFRLAFEVHDGFTALGNVAGLHVAMAAPTTEFFEQLTIQPTGTYGTKNASWGLVDEFTVNSEGLIAAPEKPGLGFAVDWDLLRSTWRAEF